MNQIFSAIISKVVLGWVRHMVGALGGSLVTQGLLTKDQGGQLIGALMVIVPLGFSAYDKWKAEQVKNAAVLAAAQKGAHQ